MPKGGPGRVPGMTEQEPLSDGEIAWIVGGLIESFLEARGRRHAKGDPDGARRLLIEIGRRLSCGEPLGSHLANYLGWAIKRFQNTDDANHAFGVTRHENRPTKNAERDRRIAFLVQREISRGVGSVNVRAAARSVSARLARDEPPIKLAPRSIENIYQALKKDSIVLTAAVFLTP